jgi:hypothetical protein
LRATLSFSEEEHVALKMERIGEDLQWDASLPQESEVTLGPKAQSIIQEALKKLDKEKHLTEDFLTLWDKFCADGAV